VTHRVTQVARSDIVSPGAIQNQPMLTQVADGIWVRQSKWVWTNSIVVRGEDGLILVDPGIDGSELNQLADDLDRLGIPVAECRLRSGAIRAPRLGGERRAGVPPELEDGCCSYVNEKRLWGVLQWIVMAASELFGGRGDGLGVRSVGGG